jgi:hypothetical protein
VQAPAGDNGAAAIGIQAGPENRALLGDILQERLRMAADFW